MFEILFALANPVILFWFCMMFFPTWRVTRFIASKQIFPIYLSLLYTIGLGIIIVQDGIGFMSQFGEVDRVIQLLADPSFAIIVWIHVLCFDQLIGHYIYQDNLNNRYVSLPLQSVILFFTLMLGPFGFICYLAIKTIKKWTSSS